LKLNGSLFLRITSKALRWQDGFSRPAWNWC
jgi:hypothetical protein